MIVTPMWLYAVMVMMRDVKRTHKARIKAYISSLVSEEERWIRGPRSQEK